MSEQKDVLKAVIEGVVLIVLILTLPFIMGGRDGLAAVLSKVFGQ